MIKWFYVLVMIAGVPLLDEAGKPVLDDEEQPVLVATPEFVSPPAVSFYPATLNLQDCIGEYVLFGVGVKATEYGQWRQADNKGVIVILAENWGQAKKDFGIKAREKLERVPCKKANRVLWIDKDGIPEGWSEQAEPPRFGGVLGVGI